MTKPSIMASIFSLMLVLLMSASSALAGEPVCVKKPRVKLRSGPGPQHKVTWIVSQHMPLMKIGSKGSWYQVQDVDGQKYWVASNMVTTRMSCAVVRVKTAKLHREPGSATLAQLRFADKYTPFKKVGREDEWVLLQDDYKGQYWVHENNIWIPVIRSKMTF